jgi:hypothetical protein
VVSIRGALNRVASLARREIGEEGAKYGPFDPLYRRILGSNIFDPEVYLSLHEDVRNAGVDPWLHFLLHGLREGRRFTTSESVARAMAQTQPALTDARQELLETVAQLEHEAIEPGTKLRQARTKIAVYCSSVGNFYMHEMADLLNAGLRHCGVDAVLRNEKSSKEEYFHLRIFVAPHEFFYLDGGLSWKDFVKLPNTVLYNVEQIQTPWFCRAFPLLLQAPLILDLNLQTAQILCESGCRAIFLMPGYLDDSAYTSPYLDISQIELTKGYRFAKDSFDWKQDDRLSSRPIDVLFVGAKTPYRDKSLMKLDVLAEDCRFVCAYRQASKPFTREAHNGAATEANWALSQRAKIVLNLHRDWIGYFEWSRMVLRGFWQGACVVTDRGLPNPVFDAGVHYLEESPRHLGELIHWLLHAEDGNRKLDATRRAGYERAKTFGSMRVALVPALRAFEQLLRL